MQPSPQPAPRETTPRETTPRETTPRETTPRETTEAMVRYIGRELLEIEQAISRCRGDQLAEPRLTGTWMAHLLISSNALLHNLLIDTARRPRRISGPG